jgi:hypothetical protein
MSADEPAIDTEQLPIPAEGADDAFLGGLRRQACAGLLSRRPRRAGERVSSEASSRVSSFVNLRVADIEASYRVEVGQATGLVEGRLAEQAPAGREAGRADGR